MLKYNKTTDNNNNSPQSLLVVSFNLFKFVVAKNIIEN